MLREMGVKSIVISREDRALYDRLRELTKSKSAKVIERESGVSATIAGRIKAAKYPTRMTTEVRERLQDYRMRLESGSIRKHQEAGEEKHEPSPAAPMDMITAGIVSLAASSPKDLRKVYDLLMSEPVRKLWGPE